MATETVVKNWKDVAVTIGLGTPVSRAFVAAVGVTALLYIAGQPKAAFTEDGAIRPFAPLSPGPDGVTTKHFLVLPAAVTLAVFLFT